jgi:hypothetical protein
MRAGIRRLRRSSCQCAKSLSVYPFFILYAMDDDQSSKSFRAPWVFVPESLTATELIEPFPQQRAPKGLLTMSACCLCLADEQFGNGGVIKQN